MFGIFMKWLNKRETKMNTTEKNGMEPIAAKRKTLEKGEKLVTNRINGNPVAEIKVCGEERCKAGTFNVYGITKVGRDSSEETIRFQDRPLTKGLNGWTDAALIAVLKDRQLSYQNGPNPSPFNERVIAALLDAESAMIDRENDRDARGVRGTDQP